SFLPPPFGLKFTVLVLGLGRSGVPEIAKRPSTFRANRSYSPVTLRKQINSPMSTQSPDSQIMIGASQSAVGSTRTSKGIVCGCWSVGFEFGTKYSFVAN